jgi:hypothetical protein
VDSRLARAIGKPRIAQQAVELEARAMRALDDLRQLDESLYERFLATRTAPHDPAANAAGLRRLWDDTFRGLAELLDHCAILVGDVKTVDDASASFDFDAFDGLGGGGGGASGGGGGGELDLGASDIGDLLDVLGDAPKLDDTDRWNSVLEKVGSIEYGLRSQYRDARARFDVALAAGETNQVLGLLDDTQSAASEGVHALVTAVYETFVPDVNPATVVPGYLTSLGRALLVRRGLAELSSKLAPHNDVLQGDQTADHAAALTAARGTMKGFVSSVVCRAMRAADRWQMVEFERELSEQPLSVARLTCEGLVKYLESLGSINQREVLVVHDQRTLDEMREALASARQLADLSPRAAGDEMDRAYQAAQRLRGRRPDTDALILQLERFAPDSSNPAEGTQFLERLEAVLAASGR